MMSKVAIFTEGGGMRGLGHITRCIGLYDAFEERNFEADLVVSGDASCEQYVSGRNVDMINWLHEESGERMLADVIVVDSYEASDQFYNECIERSGQTIILDDNIRMDYTGGTVLNGAMNAEMMDYPSNPNVNYLLGSLYTPLRKEFWEHKERVISDKIKNVLVIMGGSDLRYLSPVIVKCIRINFPRIRMTVVGVADGTRDQFEAEDELLELVSSASAAELKEIMAKSDVAISAAGQTIYELATLGVPTIAIEVVDNQKDNVLGWNKAGFIEDAGRWDDEDLNSRILSGMEVLADSAERAKRSQIGQKYIDGQGALRLADYCNSRLKD